MNDSKKSLIAYCIMTCIFSASTFAGTMSLYCSPKTSEQETADFVAQCAANGIDMLIPSVGGSYGLWQTEYGTYLPEFAPLLAAGYDALESLIRNAHLVGIKVYPSITVYNSSNLFSTHPEWATKDKNGVSHDSGLAFSYPEARTAKIPLFLDLICGYNVDGIFLDYCRYPTPDYGFDQPIIDECINTYGFDPRTVATDSAEYQIFQDIRAQSITDFVGELKHAALQCKPDIRFGGFGSVDYQEDADSYGRDWVAWSLNGFAEEVFLATYYEPISEKRANVQTARDALGPDIILHACLCPYDSGTGTHLKTEEQFLQATREQLMGGADAMWIYREDVLAENDLWNAAAKSAYKCKKVLNIPSAELVGYDANQASGDPTTVLPAWTRTGTSMTDMGNYLLQDGSGTQRGYYLSSVSQSGLMQYNNSNLYGYGIGFTVLPMEDVTDSIPDNLALLWSDDTYEYIVGIDKDTDNGASGTTGGLFCGRSGALTLQVEYDASKVNSLRPDQLALPWDARGETTNQAVSYDAGDYLITRFADNDGSQSTNNGDSGDWTSPFNPSVIMKKNSGQYKIEVKMRPIDDIKSTGYSYEYANAQISWSDDVYSYHLSFDKDSDDGGSGTLGRVSRGTSSMVSVISNIDWSIPHTIAVEYNGQTDNFTFYLDGVSKGSLASSTLASGACVKAYQNRISFGDTTSGGYHPDYNAEWYFVRLYGGGNHYIDAINWSQPRNIFAAYHNDDLIFYFYLDGKPYGYLSAISMISANVNPNIKDRIAFGDFTSSGTDVAAQWYSVGIHDTNVCGNAEIFPPMGDINADCAVNNYDLLMVADNWLKDGNSVMVSDPIAEYDASKVLEKRPDELSPAWTPGGSASDATLCADDGEYLSVNVALNDGSQSMNNGDTAEWTSPDSQTVSMINSGSEYSIVFKIQPMDDIKSASYRYEYKNIYMAWSDDLNYYLISIDKDSDDGGGGTTGDISRGYYPMVNMITGLDWSLPHEVRIVYNDAEDLFYFYIDGIFKYSITSSGLRFGATQPTSQNKVIFGDGSVLGLHPDYSFRLYYIRLYNYAIVDTPCGTSQNQYPNGDITKDCVVNLLDLSRLAENWLIN